MKFLKKLLEKWGWVEVELDTTVEAALETALTPQPEVTPSIYNITNHPDEYWVFKWKELVKLSVDLTEAYDTVCDTLMANKKLDWYWINRLENFTREASNTINHYAESKWYRSYFQSEYLYNDNVAEDCRFPQFVQPVHLLLADTTHCAGMIQKMVKGLITTNPATCKIHSVRFKSGVRRRSNPEVETRVITVTEALDEKHKCEKTVERLVNNHIRRLHYATTGDMRWEI